MDILKWLMNWYKSNCDGNWEHLFGITIDNIDNPGWSVAINLENTILEDKHFAGVQIINDDENDWFFCHIEDKIFKGAGDPDKLIKILETFKDWVEKN